MADEEQVKRLKQSVREWNEWRTANRLTLVDLSLANLNLAHLSGADLTDANLEGAGLINADLEGANLTAASLYGDHLSGANLNGAKLGLANLGLADLSGANLRDANLNGANLRGANLSGANLTGATMGKAWLGRTVFADVDLTGVTGLEQCFHHGPSTIDHRTLQKSGPLPLAFLRGVGLPDNFIEYLPSLLNRPIQHYPALSATRARMTNSPIASMPISKIAGCAAGLRRTTCRSATKFSTRSMLRSECGRRWC